MTGSIGADTPLTDGVLSSSTSSLFRDLMTFMARQIYITCHDVQIQRVVFLKLVRFAFATADVVKGQHRFRCAWIEQAAVMDDLTHDIFFKRIHVT